MLRKRFGLWVVLITALAIISGCSSMSEREECIIASATAGGLVGGGITTGIGLSKKNQSGNLEWMVPVGVAGGGLAGGVAGYFMCPTPPPTPAPSPTAATATATSAAPAA